MGLLTTWLIVMLAAVPLAAADYPQLLAEFQKTKPNVSAVHVIAESPLLVAVTGSQGSRQDPPAWGEGELLGVFAHRGDQLVPISVLPNDVAPATVKIQRQTADSITLAFGLRGDSIKIFFDPKTYFPKRIVRFAPVQVRHVAVVAGVLTLTGTDGKQDFIARERNGAWRVSTAPTAAVPAAKSSDTDAAVTPMPVSTMGDFEKARPERVKQLREPYVIEERIGPSQRTGDRLWVGKTFRDDRDSEGVGDIGYFDIPTQTWHFLHLPEMADYPATALLVEPDVIWAGRGSSGGLLRYDRKTQRTTVVPLPGAVDKIVRIGRRLYCGMTNGFAIVDMDHANRFEFTPQMDGSYTITPVV